MELGKEFPDLDNKGYISKVLTKKASEEIQKKSKRNQEGHESDPRLLEAADTPV